jgi:hypothetical protein
MALFVLKHVCACLLRISAYVRAIGTRAAMPTQFSRVLPPRNPAAKKPRVIHVRSNIALSQTGRASTAAAGASAPGHGAPSSPTAEFEDHVSQYDSGDADFLQEPLTRKLRVVCLPEQPLPQRTAAQKRSAAEDNWLPHQQPETWLAGHDARQSLSAEMLSSHHQLLYARWVLPLRTCTQLCSCCVLRNSSFTGSISSSCSSHCSSIIVTGLGLWPSSL